MPQRTFSLIKTAREWILVERMEGYERIPERKRAQWPKRLYSRVEAQAVMLLWISGCPDGPHRLHVGGGSFLYAGRPDAVP